MIDFIEVKRDLNKIIHKNKLYYLNSFYLLINKNEYILIFGNLLYKEFSIINIIKKIVHFLYPNKTQENQWIEVFNDHQPLS